MQKNKGRSIVKHLTLLILKKIFYCLINKGVHGKMITILQSIYHSVLSCVKIGNKITEYFTCNVGVRQ